MDANDNPLVRRLSRGVCLGDEDRTHLARMTAQERLVPPRTDLSRQGDRPEHVHVVLEGVACRYRLTEGGHRSIMDLILPGDFCDLHVFVLNRMDHFVGTVSECRVASLSAEALDELVHTHPRITRALWWSSLVDESVLREWLVNMGRRRSDRQMAHLFCEWHARLTAVGHADETGFPQPLTMEDLADVLGRSPVHTQRTMQVLRDEGLVVTQDRHVTIPDLARLRAYASFDPAYLHLDRPPAGASVGHGFPGTVENGARP